MLPRRDAQGDEDEDEDDDLDDDDDDDEEEEEQKQTKPDQHIASQDVIKVISVISPVFRYKHRLLTQVFKSNLI